MKPQWNVIVPLAALGMIRALMHVHHVYDRMPRAEGIVWTLTLAAWISVVVIIRTPRPLATLSLTGALNGFLAAIIQQLFWERFWLTVQNYDTLAVNVLDPVVRGMVFISSIVTGLLWGTAAGVLAAILSRVMYPKPKKPTSLALNE